ncbi:hypothetical protein D3C81_862900 [compost metagenome]
MQTRAQADLGQHVSADAAKVSGLIDKGQRQKVFVDRDFDTRMVIQPTLFVHAEMQPMLAGNGHPADTPAAPDAHTLFRRNDLQRRIENVQQPGVFPGHGKTEGLGFHARKIAELNVVEVVLLDQVIGAEQVAQIDVSLTERHGTDRRQCRGIQLHVGFWVKRLDRFRWQVVIEHRHPFARQVFRQVVTLIDARHQGRVIVSVRRRDCQFGVRRLKTVSGADHIDLAVLQRRQQIAARGVAPDLDRDVQQLFDQLCVIGRQAFVIIAVAGDRKRRVIRAAVAEQQTPLAAQPAPVRLIEWHGILVDIRATEQLQCIGLRRGHGLQQRH